MAEYNPENPRDRAALAEQLAAALTRWGLTEIRATGERVFARELEPTIQLRVYTSIVGREVRACGEDAIRVALLYTGSPQRGLGSDRRVHRTGTVEAILARVKDRIDNVASASVELERCRYCESPKFKARSQRLVCAALCWKKAEAEPELQPAPTIAPSPSPQPQRPTSPDPGYQLSTIANGRRASAPKGREW